MKHLEVCNERRIYMPTMQQLVRKGRSAKTRKSKSPVLGIGYNSREKKNTHQN